MENSGKTGLLAPAGGQNRFFGEQPPADADRSGHAGSGFGVRMFIRIIMEKKPVCMDPQAVLYSQKTLRGSSMRLAALMMAIGVAVASCGAALPPPETTAREIVKAAFAQDLAALTARLSGDPLRTLLAANTKPLQESVCRRLVRMESVPEHWQVRFARAVYQDDGSTVTLHLCLQSTKQDKAALTEMFWKMSYVDGGWKLVAYE